MIRFRKKIEETRVLGLFIPHLERKLDHGMLFFAFDISMQIQKNSPETFSDPGFY